MAKLVLLSWFWLTGWALCGCASLGVSVQDYPKARDQNLLDIATEEGKQYEREFCECVRRDYANALNACISALADPDLSAFEMILTIEPDGSVDEICLSTQTEVAGCLRGELLDGRFARPPFAPFRVHVSMRLH